MILIQVSETGFVSGQAWETIAYEGDTDSRIIHTVLNIPPEFDGTNYSISYKIKSKLLDRVAEVSVDSEFNTQIPKEFMNQSQRLWFQLFIKTDVQGIEFHSNPFTLDIHSSIGPDANVILKPGAHNFIVVNSLEERDSIPRSQLADGKVVKVNDEGYFSWNDELAEWEPEVFEISDIKNLESTLQDILERIVTLEER